MKSRKAKLSLINSNLPSYLNVYEGDDFKVRGRIQLEDDRAPSWITESGSIAVLDDGTKDVSVQLSAELGQGSIMRYGLLPQADGTGGFLPFGLTLNSSTGLISGDIERVQNHSIEPITFFEEDRPVWNTGSQTWFHNEEEGINIVLSATPVTGNSIHYTINDGYLPWGIVLSKDGTISGTTNQTIFGEADKYTQSPPSWNTPLGLIMVSEELEQVSYQLSADASDDNPNSSLSYRIVDGNLPWGLSLTSNGLIEGQNTEVYNKDIVPPDVFPKPLWVTPFGLIKKMNERESVEIQMEATPQNGTIMEYRIISGNLPWGIALTSDGMLSGGFDEIIYPELPDIIDDNAPVINSSSSLGDYIIEQDINIPLAFGIYEGRTIKRVFVERTDTMPLGITLSSQTGLIGGTISADTKLGTYSFTVTVVDTAGMRSSKVFNMTVV